MAARTEPQPAAPLAPHLQAVGPGVTLAIELPAAGSLLVGRGEEADIRLADLQVSRQHARLHVGATFEIEDLDSANGTYVCGERLPAGGRARFQPGDVVCVGSTVLLVRCPPGYRPDGPAGQHAPPPPRFLVKDGDRATLVRQEDIDWVGSAGNFVEIHAGGACHLRRETLASIERRLDPDRFRRIHRTAIVSHAAVKELARGIHGWEVVLKSGRRLAIARSLQDQVLAWLGG